LHLGALDLSETLILFLLERASTAEAAAAEKETT